MYFKEFLLFKPESVEKMVKRVRNNWKQWQRKAFFIVCFHFFIIIIMLAIRHLQAIQKSTVVGINLTKSWKKKNKERFWIWSYILSMIDLRKIK